MNYELIFTAFIVGVLGDSILQSAGDIAGLKPYFKQHGIFESLLIAGGIMFISTWLFLILKLPLNYVTLFIYGGVLDIIWRKFNLMPSLTKTYYNALNPVYSFIWGGIPMILVLLSYNIFKKYGHRLLKRF